MPRAKSARTPAKDSRAHLHAAGLRVTKPRLLVYDVLRVSGGHRSADDVAALLADLTAAGLLMCADVGPGRALYEVAERWHHHFICRVCGMVLDVPCVRGEKPCLDPPASLPGTVEEAQVLFRGVCDQCRAASGKHP